MFERVEMDDAARLLDIIKRLNAQHKRTAKLSDKLAEMDWRHYGDKQIGTARANLNEALHELDVLSYELHAASVDAGIADIRSAEFYAPRTWFMSSFHEYQWTPEQPKSLKQGAAA